MKKIKTTWRKRHCASAIVCCLTMALLQGCANASQGDFCGIYYPVYTVDGDDEETRRQADANNAVWLELCQ